ncbi:MAG: toxic anion resistance protein [Clostridiales bacterium]|jgi:uncharacterized protein YaaN involved in tellurite resistance|nr:toxic anion resistance protein [Clostridiales bacterium]
MAEIPRLVLPGDESEHQVSTVPASNGRPAPSTDLTLSGLDPEERKAVTEFTKQINLMDQNTVAMYGTSAQKKVADFSDSVLNNYRTRDTGEVGDCLTNLVMELKGFDATTDEKPGFFGGLFNSAKKYMERMQTGYAKAEVNIDKIQTELETHQRGLLKDISLFDSLYEKNLVYYKELSMYILAGEEKLKQFIENDIAAQRLRAQNGDQMEAQKLNDMQALADRFDKKLHDLKLSRIISIQMAPQIRLLQNNNAALSDKIQSSIVNSIPIWKNQMVLALGMQRTKKALEAQTKVTDYTNEMLQRNSELLKQGSIDVARESERSIISVETIRKTNENLIDTISEVLQIHEQGKADRRAAEQELLKAEEELKGILLSNPASGSRPARR